MKELKLNKETIGELNSLISDPIYPGFTSGDDTNFAGSQECAPGFPGGGGTSMRNCDSYLCRTAHCPRPPDLRSLGFPGYPYCPQSVIIKCAMD